MNNKSLIGFKVSGKGKHSIAVGDHAEVDTPYTLRFKFGHIVEAEKERSFNAGTLFGLEKALRLVEDAYHNGDSLNHLLGDLETTLDHFKASLKGDHNE